MIEGRQVIDTVWELRVRHRAGLLSKEWSAGCLNGDNPGDGFESVKWISAASLAVTVTDGRRDTWRDTAADVFGCSGMLRP